MPASLISRLGCDHPIIQAPMAGGGDTPALVAAVSAAGGLGCIGAAYLTPEQIRAAAHAVRRQTSRAFGINLFAPLPPPPATNVEAAIARLHPYYGELGLGPPSVPAAATEFAEQLEAALDCGAALFSFTFGRLPAYAIAAIRQRGLLLAGTATTVAEALALEADGVDAIIAQGSEAGGHRGTFLGEFGDALIGTIALVPQIVDAVRVPVIASGGIMDGRGIVAALALGAVAVQLGTAFLTTREAGVPEAYKAALLAASEDSTRVTRAFSGRPARGVINRFMREIDADDELTPAFPIQNALTRPLRAAAARQERAEFLSLWAGQGVRLARRDSAADLVARLVRESRTAFRQTGEVCAV